jgi:hypothetical protein
MSIPVTLSLPTSSGEGYVKHPVSKIGFIKLVREHTGLALKEAKSLVDSLIEGRSVGGLSLSPSGISAFRSFGVEVYSVLADADDHFQKLMEMFLKSRNLAMVEKLAAVYRAYLDQQ